MRQFFFTNMKKVEIVEIVAAALSAWQQTFNKSINSHYVYNVMWDVLLTDTSS